MPDNAEAVIDLPGTYQVVLQSDAVVTKFLFDSPNATLGGPGTITVQEGFTWRNGILGGDPVSAVIARGGLLISGFNGIGGRSLSRALINLGTASWNDSSILQLGNGGTISNAASGVFEVSGDARIEAVGGSRWIWNAGRLRKTGAGALDLGAELRNSGSLEIDSGTVILRQGSRHSGSLQITNLAGLMLAGGTHVFTPESKLSGAGGLTISGGTTTLEGAVDLSGPHLFRGGTVVVSGAFQAISNLLTIDGANVTFTGPFRCVSNQLDIVSGSARFEGAGVLEPSSLRVGPAGRLEGTTPIFVRGPLTVQAGAIAGTGTLVARDGLILGAGGLSLSGRALVNGGAGRWSGASGSLSMARDSAITNLAGASFDLDLDAIVADSGGAIGFINEGRFRKTGGLETALFTTPFSNRGTLETLSGGLTLRGGGKHSGAFELVEGTQLTFGGNHTLDADSTMSGDGTLSVSSGTVDFQGLVDVRGSHVFSGGVANLTGRYNAISNQVMITGGKANFSGSGVVTPSSLVITNLGVLSGVAPVSVGGPMRWSGGRIEGSGSVVAEEELEMIGGALTMSGRALVNRGAGRWRGTSGTLSMERDSVITNQAGASFDLELDTIVADSGGAIGFINDGRFRKTDGLETALFTTPFSNRGMLQTLSGGLTLRGGGKHRGAFQVGEGTQLTFGGNHTLDADSRMSGNGTLSVSSGTVDFGGLVDVRGSHVFSGGVANLTGRYNAITNQVMITGGKANFSGSGAVTPSSLVITNLGVLSGVAPVSVGGPMRWSGGRIEGSGPVVAERELEMIGGALTMSGRALVNRGAGRWRGTSGTLSMERDSVITNLAGASYDLELDTIVADSGGAIGFINEGRFRKTGGSETALFTTPFSNRGMLQTLSGGLILREGGRHSGAFELGEGTQLTFGGNHTLDADSTMSGNGTLSVSSGTVDFEGQVDVRGSHVFSGGVANLRGRYNAITNQVLITGGKANFSGSGVVTPSSLVITNLGVLGGVAPVSVGGPMRWSGGRIEGSGSVVAERELEMIGGALTMSGRALVNRGTGRWRGTSGTLSMERDSAITNLVGATFDLELGAIVADAGGAIGFINEGRFRKTGSSETALFTTPFRNSGTMELLSGTLSLRGGLTQTAGSLLLRGGGELESAVPIRILGGRLQGAGRVLGSITNQGIVRPGEIFGRLLVFGDYSQGAGGVLEVGLGGIQPMTQHGQLTITNLATLGGSLAVDLAEGFSPAPNAAFEVLQCGRCNGAFDALLYPSNVVGMAVEYSASNVLVRVVNTPPIVDPVPDQSVDAAGIVAVKIAARDADVPVQTLRYALTNAPAGASVDEQGLVRWVGVPTTPGYTTNLTVVVTDSGTPNLSVSRTFGVRVGDSAGVAAVGLRIGVPAAGSNTIAFRGLPGVLYHAEYSLDVLGPWFDLADATAAADGSWSVVDRAATNVSRFYRAR